MAFQNQALPSKQAPLKQAPPYHDHFRKDIAANISEMRAGAKQHDAGHPAEKQCALFVPAQTYHEGHPEENSEAPQPRTNAGNNAHPNWVSHNDTENKGSAEGTSTPALSRNAESSKGSPRPGNRLHQRVQVQQHRQQQQWIAGQEPSITAHGHHHHYQQHHYHQQQQQPYYHPYQHQYQQHPGYHQHNQHHGYNHNQPHYPGYHEQPPFSARIPSASMQKDVKAEESRKSQRRPCQRRAPPSEPKPQQAAFETFVDDGQLEHKLFHDPQASRPRQHPRTHQPVIPQYPVVHPSASSDDSPSSSSSNSNSSHDVPPSSTSSKPALVAASSVAAHGKENAPNAAGAQQGGKSHRHVLSERSHEKNLANESKCEEDKDAGTKAVRRRERSRERRAKNGAALTSESKEESNEEGAACVSPASSRAGGLSNMLLPRSKSGYARCLITRDKRSSYGVGSRFYPTLQLFLQGGAPGSPPVLAMVAQKQTGNRTTNYRFFDMTQKGQVFREANKAGQEPPSSQFKKLNKKAGNYIGKLRGNFSRDEYTVYVASNTDIETKKMSLCSIVYDKTDMMSTMRDGAQPRKMGVLVPLEKEQALPKKGLQSSSSTTASTHSAGGAHGGSEEETYVDSCDTTGEDKAGATKLEVDNRTGPEERLATCLAAMIEERVLAKDPCHSTGHAAALSANASHVSCKGDAPRYIQLSSKEPVFDKGNYRLNFRGRVKLPSVKNYQLVPLHDIDDVWTQFGKVSEHEFHLDFKRPLSPLVAFAIAITQFDY